MYNAKWYHLWVTDAGNNSFDSWYRASEVSNDDGTCSITPDGLTLESGGATFWIQPWNPNGYGPWSEEMAFTVE